MFIRKEVPPKLEILCKKRVYILIFFIFVGNSAIFILPVKNWGGMFFLMKKIC